MTSSATALQSKANPQQLEAILATDGPVLIIAGRGYATEMPYVIQLSMLCLSVHSLCLLLTVSGQRASAKAESNLEENALKDTENA